MRFCGVGRVRIGSLAMRTRISLIGRSALSVQMKSAKGGRGMDAKAFLKSVEKLDVLICNKMIEKEQWRDVALGIVSGGQSVMIERNGKKELHNMEKVQSSGSQSKMADAIDKCLDMEDEINALIDRLIDTKRQVIEVIEQVESPTEYNILHLRHIQYKTLQEIADKYKKDYGWATTTYGRALKSVQHILDEGL